MPRKKVIIIKVFIFTESMLWILNVLVILVRSQKLDRWNKLSKFIEFRWLPFVCEHLDLSWSLAVNHSSFKRKSTASLKTTIKI